MRQEKLNADLCCDQTMRLIGYDLFRIEVSYSESISIDNDSLLSRGISGVFTVESKRFL